LNEEEAAMEEVDDERTGEESLPAYQHLILPSRSVAGVWESLILEENTKETLLGYATSALLFSDKKVNTNLVSWNRLNEATEL